MRCECKLQSYLSTAAEDLETILKPVLVTVSMHGIVGYPQVACVRRPITVR